MPRQVTVEPPAPRPPPPPGTVPYAVGDYVEVAGRLGNEICLYIVQILSLWTSPYVGFTGLYYYTPRDLGDKIMAQFPSKASTPHNITAPESSSSGANSSTDAAATTATEVHKCEDQEIFQSTYSGDNHVAAIVRKCNVVSSSAFHHQLVHSPDVGSTYLCRYAFHAWKFPSPFTKLITDEDRVRVRLGDDCQVDVPPFQEPTKSPIDAKTDRKTEVVECLDFPPDEAVDATEATPHHHGLRRWEPRLADAAPLTAFLTLVECIQIGVGNVVYAWHDKAKEQILSVLEEYTGDHSFRVVYLDGSGSLDVDVQFVRGLVSTDEALMLLHDAGYNYRIATEQVTQLVSARSAAAVKFVRDAHADDGDLSDASTASHNSSSPRSIKRQCKQSSKPPGKPTGGALD
ncbi:hypothetical protein H310_08939 [Aphanomyces invadans]|uniref:BAH domain-containing protein n=1 Tax=Aphanomyces invadans TaxID=157072 RepID=A0A024TX50_9STRA|nr:hypothetical protein H310_08939 [Aphanomyces invadans]ETV98216.1 hypothetical protein H310_08939 [Aphanomyces invadans]|eukprot:XP_008873091.1 hypothetical protein H310_08939 [Aphanomyces invadans]